MTSLRLVTTHRSTRLIAADDACTLDDVSARRPPLPEPQALTVVAKISTAKRRARCDCKPPDAWAAGPRSIGRPANGWHPLPMRRIPRRAVGFVVVALTLGGV